MSDTKWQCMKESNTLVGNVSIKHLQRQILPDTKGQCMRESSLHWKSKINVKNFFIFLQIIFVNILSQLKYNAASTSTEIGFDIKMTLPTWIYQSV